MRPPVGMPKLSRRSRILLIVGALILGAFLLASQLLGTYVDWLWFGEVGFSSVFTTVLFTRIALFVAVAVLIGGSVGLSLFIAYRSRPVFVPVAGPDDPVSRYRTAVLARVRIVGWGIPLAVGLVAGTAAQSEWERVQLFLNSVPFGVNDPEFGRDISFYAFRLPFYEWLVSWAFVAVAGAFFVGLIAHYIFGGIRLAGRGGQLSAPARVQLAVLAGVFVLLYGVSYYLDRFGLLLSTRKAEFNGATYTDLHAVMPAKLILTIIAVICAVAFFVGAFVRNLQIPVIAAVLMVLSSVLLGAAWPLLLEQFSVRPNPIARESQSIERNIAATRNAYGLTSDKVKYTDYAGKSDSSQAEVKADQGTIPNIRLLDPGVLAPTFTQQQQRKNFYSFGDKLDIDRYTLDGKIQDYIVAVRELNSAGLAENQRDWLNRHLTYTHGDGFVAAPANTVNSALQDGSGQGGYPNYQVSDLSTKSAFNVEQPRIYFGEKITDYAIVGKAGQAAAEYDTDSSKYTYTGKGGVPIGNWFNRLAFAANEGERNILFSGAIGSDSKIIYNRNPRDRVMKAAPWLTVDADPYPAVVDGRIQWIVDGYTTLQNYPYAQRSSLGETVQDSLPGQPRLPNTQINYIRNSVKATVDAYDGTVTLYAVDEQDPVLKAWRGVFPNLVKGNSEVKPSLRAHFRYPEDLFKVQRSLLARYHVEQPGVFFNQNEFWDVPDDPTDETVGTSTATGNREGKQPPYYVVAQLNGQNKPTFQLTSALTGLRREFLAAWVSASSDPDTYGQINVLRLPTNTQTEGPGQVQNRFFSTPEVTENRTLFSNPNASAVNGNLITLPVAGGLLYVEPIYIQRKDQNAFPQLARVLVSFGNRVGFKPTLAEALDQVFGAGAGSNITNPGQPGGGTTTPGQPPNPNTGGLNEAAQRAAADMVSAWAKYKKAQTDGDYATQGQALKDLDDASKRFDTARQAPPPQQPQPSSSNQPTPTSKPGG
ncbi:UPF0182 family protein [Crossiella cryophila]|nr:UPF0182 family protein [Crossiella cryophila]